ncbi:MAG TPA: hypothetical protein VGH03_03440 [Caulobacteraceae bacterium]|jgi:hypothetical protein
MIYSVHFFDGEGRETSWEEIECASDAEAINATLDAAAGRPAELWLGDRRLIWWPGEPNRSRPSPARPRAPRLAVIEASYPVSGSL